MQLVEDVGPIRLLWNDEIIRMSDILTFFEDIHGKGIGLITWAPI